MQNNNYSPKNIEFNQYYERSYKNNLKNIKNDQNESYIKKNREIYNNINNYKRSNHQNKNYNHLENYIPSKFSSEINHQRESNTNIIMCRLDELENINYINKYNECKLDNLINMDNSTSDFSENSYKNDLVNETYPSLILKKNNDTLSTLENSGKKKKKSFFENLNQKCKDNLINRLSNLNGLDKIFEGKSYKKNEEESENFSVLNETVEFCFNDWEKVKETNKKLRKELGFKNRLINNYRKQKHFSLEDTHVFFKRNDYFTKKEKIKDLKNKKKKLLTEKIVEKKKITKYNEKINIDEKNFKFQFFKIKNQLEEKLNFLKVNEINKTDLIKNYELNNPKIKKYLDFFIEKKKETKILKNKIDEFKGFFSQDYYEELEKTKIKAKRLKEKLIELKKINSKLKKKRER